MSEALFAASPNDQSARIGAMLAHYSLGVNLLLNGERADGLARLREALAEAEAIQNASPGNDYIINQVASIKAELGEALITGNPKHAEGCRLIDEALSLWDTLVRRSAMPGESARHRKRFEAVRETCGAPM